jgi:solute carrier family 25 carnitine/acylcarnitine transporter 20/29
MSGGLAGVSSWAIIYPQDVIKSRVQAAPLNTPPSELKIAHIAKQMYRTESLKDATKGMGATLARAFLVNAVLFLTYDAVLNGLNGL